MLCTVGITLSGSSDAQERKYKLSGIDGPYIFGNRVYRVNKQSTLEVAPLQRRDSIIVRANNETRDSFYVALREDYKPLPDSFAMPERLLAISDVEGNFNAFAGFLERNGVIDQGFNWCYGKGHLVLVGDLMDRDENVVPILWLLYKLEGQAKNAGGAVHCILGNHDVMNFQGNYKYNAERYRAVSQLIYQAEHKGRGKADSATQKDCTRFLYSPRSELGAWLHSKNGIARIGDYIFLHGGLSPRILPYKLSITRINTLCRAHWDERLYHHPGPVAEANFLMGREGIFWYRGLLKGDKKYYGKATGAQVDSILAQYGVEKIVVGHTIISDRVTSHYNGRVIAVDVHHGKEKQSGKTKGLLIEHGVEYEVNALGQRASLQEK